MCVYVCVGDQENESYRRAALFRSFMGKRELTTAGRQYLTFNEVIHIYIYIHMHNNHPNNRDFS